MMIGGPFLQKSSLSRFQKYGSTLTELHAGGESEVFFFGLTLVEAEDIARVALFLASDELGWVRGERLPASDGQRT